MMELISGAIIGALSATILHFMDISMTPTQTAILVGSIIFITTAVSGIFRKLQEKKEPMGN